MGCWGREEESRRLGGEEKNATVSHSGHIFMLTVAGIGLFVGLSVSWGKRGAVDGSGRTVMPMVLSMLTSLAPGRVGRLWLFFFEGVTRYNTVIGI